MTLQRMTREHFEPYIQQEFQVELASGFIPFTLVEVNTLGTGTANRIEQHPFSVIFRGPLLSALPQAIYSLGNPGIGTLDIFLVPIGPDGEGMRYEAVFN